MKGLVMGVCRKGERLVLLSMRDCESIRADKGEPNVCDVIIQMLNERHREEGWKRRPK